MLWPKFENQNVALNLSYTGTIKDEILDKIEISYNLLKFLVGNYIERICERYSFSKDDIINILNNNEIENPIYEIMQLIGKKRGAIVSGGMVDDEKTARIILDDFRSGKFGKITIEKIKNT